MENSGIFEVFVLLFHFGEKANLNIHILLFPSVKSKQHPILHKRLSMMWYFERLVLLLFFNKPSLLPDPFSFELVHVLGKCFLSIKNKSISVTASFMTLTYLSKG